MRLPKLIALVSMVLIGIVLFGGLWAFGVGSQETKDEAAALEALRTAPECESLPEKPASCAWTGELEYVGSERHGGGRGGYWYSIDLRETQPGRDGGPGFIHTVEVSDLDDFEGLTYKDPVTATLWRGQIVEVRLHGQDLPTWHHPVEVPEPLTETQRTVVLVLGGGAVVAGGLLPYLQSRRAKAAARNRIAGG
ncbi:hypothetical protein J2S40_004655 [Nocardioides luteus]|uniref:DUF3592 domain-containing protein n=1 Tax=Nocardioides luteus TaxID=1844 RepID=A0ABQ5SZ12_9ACTN|nr:hypothetical protein [Nocardioides luteus]MDR7313597.1 hypothetical protein [Nocardioides luteus]GGR69135.1 hypothetical protein GCM10010197_40830 [Nocardioides luteus]GLJ69219.1 hypothetical protein GCM10017579_32550 [Nocardioides luteus]